ncbi:MAG: DUF4367 domain-containing protein [Oscillospiraceae bacterium]|jgi:hypothetical protein|nr:DUF4367 domain-containing protein [Oscillospiraceae bacterium]
MQAYSENARNRIFDSILTEALKESYRREVALYKDSDEHTFSEEFEKNIRSISKQIRLKQNIEKFKKSTPKIATTAAALIIIFTLAANPVVHAFFKNIIVRLSDGFNRHEFIDDIIITIENFNQELRPAYLPEGYQISLALYSPTSMIIDYINQRENIEDDTTITLEYRIADASVISTEIENSEKYHVFINGRDAVFYESTTEDRTGYLIWNSGGYAFVLIAQIEMREFVKIAESINIS